MHGRCLTGAVWGLVADELRGRGRRVEVVELHRGSLLADTEAVQEVVDLLGEPVVVCGWSYGGMVITGLALRSSSHLVYLCALMPAEGESAIELGSRHPGGLAALVDTDEAGDLVLRGDQLDEILWPDAPAETAAMARTMLRPQAMQSFLEAPPRVAWRQTPSTYVAAGTTAPSTDGSSTRWHRGQRSSLSGIRATLRCCHVPTLSVTYSPASTLASPEATLPQGRARRGEHADERGLSGLIPGR